MVDKKYTSEVPDNFKEQLEDLMIKYSELTKDIDPWYINKTDTHMIAYNSKHIVLYKPRSK